MNLTDYHAKLFAHELTKRSSSDNVEKLAPALSFCRASTRQRPQDQPPAAGLPASNGVRSNPNEP
jgi:hypothetical protein